MTPRPSDLVAVLPAAGSGSRLRLDGSKELVAIGPEPGDQRPVIDWALRRVSGAGVRRAAVVTAEGKQDLQAALARGGAPDSWPDVEVLCTPPTPSSVHTVAVALERDTTATWLLVYPDILTTPSSALTTLVRHARRGSSDVTLALFPSDRPDKVDMVDIDEQGRLLGLRIKQPDAGLRFTWAYACWRPSFTELILQELGRSGEIPEDGHELHLGNLLQRAVGRGLSLNTIAFETGFALDIGTGGDLRRARESPDPDFFT